MDFYAIQVFLFIYIPNYFLKIKVLLSAKKSKNIVWFLTVCIVNLHLTLPIYEPILFLIIFHPKTLWAYQLLYQQRIHGLNIFLEGK